MHVPCLNDQINGRIVSFVLVRVVDDFSRREFPSKFSFGGAAVGAIIRAITHMTPYRNGQLVEREQQQIKADLDG